MEKNKKNKKKTPKKTRIIAAIVAAVVIIGGATAIYSGSRPKVKGSAYVMPVSYFLNGGTDTEVQYYSGIVTTSGNKEIKNSDNRTIKEIKVKVGDNVKKGDVLFTFDTEADKLDLEKAKLEVEKLDSDIETNKGQITELNKQLNSTRDSDTRLSLSNQIKEYELQNSQNEYDKKVKQQDVDKYSKLTKNSEMKSPVSGTITKVNTSAVTKGDSGESSDTDMDTDDSSMYSNDPTSTDSTSVVTVAENDNLIIKGTVNEQNRNAIYKGLNVEIDSRADDSKWNGTVNKVNSENINPNNSDGSYNGGEDGSNSQSSNYNFYVKLDSDKGLIVGQHVKIMPDDGTNSDAEEDKDKIMLYSDFIADIDGDKPYVWADKKGKLTKIYITLGKSDDETGEVEIKSGITKDTLIAYPSSSYKEGMKTVNTDDSEKFYSSSYGDESGSGYGDSAAIEES